MKIRLFFFTLFFLTIAFTNPVVSADGDPDPYFMTGSGFNEQLLDMALQSDGKLVIAGKFTSIVGVPVNKVSRLTASGDVDLTFNNGGSGANGDVRVVKILPDGKILIGGDFTNYNGTNVNRIARLNSDGTLDTTFNTGTGASSSVYQITLLANNKLLVAGGFSTFNNLQKRVLVRLFYDGAVDEIFTFTPNFSFNAPIKSLAVQTDGKILIGGHFYNSDTGQNNNIARLDVNGNLDTAFQARTNWYTNTPVNAIYIRSDGKILIGGQFSQVNGVERANIALLNSNGTLDTNYNPTTVGRVYDIAPQNDGKIVLVGYFFVPNSLEPAIIRLNSNGTLDTGFNTIESTHFFELNTVLITPDNKILAGGELFRNPTNIGGADPMGVRRYNSDGSPDYSHRTRSGAVKYLQGKLVLQPNGKIVFRLDGTTQRTVGGLERFGLGRLNSDGLVDESFAPDIGATAITALTDNSIIAGGVQDSGRRYLRRINPDGSIDSSFSVETVSEFNAPGLNTADMASRPDGKFYVAGNFISIGGHNRKGIARLNPDGNLDETFNTNVGLTGAEVYKVVPQPDGKVWMSVRPQPNFIATNVFRLNESGTAETFTQLNSYVHDIAYLNDGRAYLCGDFTSLGSNQIKYIVRLNQNGTIDTTFNTPTIGGVGSNFVIRSCLAQPDGKLIIGGSFFTINGVSRNSFARLNADGSLDQTFSTSLNSGALVYSIIRQPDGNILLGGRISFVNNLEKVDITRLLLTSKRSSFDFDGDGKTDVGIYRPSVGEWWYSRSSDNQTFAVQFGTAADKTVPADFTGDGKTDIAFWRESTGEWFVLRSEDNSFYGFPFGQAGDIPAPGDFDGDGRADAAVFRPSNSVWYILRSSDGGVTAQQFGVSEDLPVVADYDGDGKDDIAVYRPSVSEWWILRSTAGLAAAQFGVTGDKTVPGDYTGDGKADIAFWRPSTGFWYILRSEDNSFYAFPFGTVGDVSTPGDYDGDGRSDAAVFRPSNSTWYIQRSTGGFIAIGFGTTGDQPIPNSYVRN